MPDNTKKSLSQYRLGKAEECYLSAKELLAGGHFSDSANRSYYAIFHAIRAILALEGADFKKHSGVISYFQQRYIKTGVFDKELSVIVKRAFRIRQDSDYEDFFLVSKEDVSEQLENARLFLDVMKTYLQKQ
ncbi:HEPN domain-containing protein [Anaerotruncus rubiinfantis]|uniref:HEPN domain-containing protein n=1 Tax=Anaerotruncus rubiinfantis TaxID=1720200 RepID=UPI000832323C|nr:HEPN domain-containing protein [Anaerotruncus rubiinfantis]